jgi:hypothetical protein
MDSRSQDADTPSGQGFDKSLKLACTTANASLSASNHMVIIQRIEGHNLQHLKFGTANAESLTVSFWIKSNKTGTYTNEFYVNDGPRHINTEFTINSADTWEKKTITIAGDISGVINNDNGSGLEWVLWLAAGTDFTSGTLQTSWDTANNVDRASSSNVNLADSTSNYINITGVQLEVGDTATPFEHRPYDMELQRCLRYYFKHAQNGSNTMYGIGHCRSNYMRGLLHLPIAMRTNPTMSNTGTDADYYLTSGTTDYTSFTTRPLADGSSPYVVNFRVQVASLTNGYAAVLYMNSANSYLAFDAEL